MNELPELFANNRRRADEVESRQSGFFADLAAAEAQHVRAVASGAVGPGGPGARVGFA